MIFLWRIGLAIRFYGPKWERFSPRSDVLILRCWPFVIAWHRTGEAVDPVAPPPPRLQ